MDATPTLPRTFFKAYPKVELHRHLEGSLRLSTMLELAHKNKLDVPLSDPPKLRALVQVLHEDPFTSENFLSKFKTLRLFFTSREVIERITREAIADAAEDNVQYMELRFTPVALARAQGYPLDEVMDWVIRTTKDASQTYGVQTNLIASVNRHEPLSVAEEVAQYALERLDRGIVALDLAGNEAEYPAAPFVPLFREVQEAGMRITIHAGEWGNAENIRDAITNFNTERVGHGVRIFEDPSVVDLARERGTVFEVCPTSNYQSGVIEKLAKHPLLAMAENGLNVTINTDDPGISDIELTDEYAISTTKLGMSIDMLYQSMISAASAAFISPEQSELLIHQLQSMIPTHPTA